MDIQNLFNYATTALECAAMLTFSKCVLRISDKKIFLYIALVSVICGSLVKLQVDLFDYETLTIPLQLLLQVFVNVMLFGVAYWSGLLLALFGLVIAGLFQLALGFAGSEIGITSFDQLLNNFLHQNILQVLECICIFLVSYLLNRRKIGFNFLNKKSYKEAKKYLGILQFAILEVILFVMFFLKFYETDSFWSPSLAFTLVSTFMLAIFLYKVNRDEIEAKLRQFQQRYFNIG